MLKLSFSCNVYDGSVRKLQFSLATLKFDDFVFANFEKVLKKRLYNQDGLCDYL